MVSVIQKISMVYGAPSKDAVNIRKLPPNNNIKKRGKL